MKAAAGRVQVFSMVGAMTTAETIELTRHAQACGADGVGVVTPYYFKLIRRKAWPSTLCASQRAFRPTFRSTSTAFRSWRSTTLRRPWRSVSSRRGANVVGIKYSYPDMPRS